MLKPAETTPLTALLLAEICQEAELPPGVVNDRPRRRRAPARRSCASRTSTRSPSPARPPSARTSRPRWPAAACRSRSSSAASRPTSCSRTPRSTRRSRASSTASSSTRATSAAPGSRLLVQECVADVVDRQALGADGPLRVGDPLDKNTDVGAINSRRAAARIESLVDAGEEEGAPRRTVACELPERGWWFAPTLFTDVAPAHRIAVEEIFGPVRLRAHLPHAGRGDREGQQLALRPGGRHLDRQGREGVRGRAGAAGRRGLAEHLQPLRPDGARSAATRRAASAARAAPAGLRPVPEVSMSRLAGPQDLQAVRRRRVRALGVGPLRPPTPTASFNVPRGSRKDVRDAVKAARGALGPWAARTAYNRGQILYRAAEALESRGEPSSRRSDARSERASDRDRRARALRRLDRQAARPCSAASTRSRRRSCRSRCPSRPASSASWRPTSPSCSAWSPSWRRRSRPATRSSRWCRSARPLAGLDLGEVLGVSDVPGGVVNLLSGRRAELVPRARGATAT